MPKRNDERATAMYALYQSGLSAREVGKRFGVKQSTVLKIFKRRNFALRSQPEGLSATDIDKAVNLYDSGFSIAQVAKHFSISRQAMWDHLRKRTTMRDHLRYGAENTFYRGGPKSDDYVHNLVEQAIEDGVLVRPEKCEQCRRSGRNKDGSTIIQAHHCDYNKPLEVMWLCNLCHFDWHLHNTPIEVRK